MSHLYDLAVAFSNKTPPPGDLRAPGQTWTGACGALCNQFQLYIGGWAKLPTAYGPDAETIGDHSSPLNLDVSKAPIGAWHFWHLGANGHVAPDLNGGGTALFMATSRALGVDLGNSLRIVSVAQYSASGGATYRGWSTNYYGGISAYKEPVIVVAPNQRQVVSTSGVKRRAQPNIDDASNPGINPPIPANTVTTPKGWITGQEVVGSTIWFQNEDSTYSHASGFTDGGIHDLVDLNPKPPIPPDPTTGPTAKEIAAEVALVLQPQLDAILAAASAPPVNYTITLNGTATPKV